MGEIRLHGRGGQGTVIGAEMLANAFVFDGKYASVFPSFGVERRGSPVMAFARYGEAPIRERTRVYRPDILLFLDQTILEDKSCYNGFKNRGMIIANTRQGDFIEGLGLNQSFLATVDAVRIALEETGTAITNTTMLGAFARATGLVKLEDLKTALGLYFSGKILEKNLRSLARGYEEVQVTTYPDNHTGQDVGNWPEHLEASIKEPQMTSPFEAAWSDVSKKILTVQTGTWRHRRPVVDKDTCRLCGWCSVNCFVGCMNKAADGYFQPDMTYCKGCGICARECPAHAIRMTAEEAAQ